MNIVEKDLQKIWQKTHILWSQLDYLIQERDSRPEPVQSKHAWDMILQHICTEINTIRNDISNLMKEENKP